MILRCADLPTGTVTFLFTDTEGSTRLLRELSDEYVAVLAEDHRGGRTGRGRTCERLSRRAGRQLTFDDAVQFALTGSEPAAARRETQRKPMWLMPVSIICGRRAAGR